MAMGPLALLLLMVLIVFVILFLITLIQKEKTKSILRKLSSIRIEYAEVSFNMVTSSKYSVSGGTTYGAGMYYSEDFIMFAPRVDEKLGLVQSYHFPILFTSDVNKYKKILKIENVIQPAEITLTSINNIKIKFKLEKVTIVNYDIRVNFIDNEDLERFKSIENKLIEQSN